MNGKNRCRILKDIRKKIAEENGIEYVTTECKYKGDCLGTCPKCESEVRFLENELNKKRSLGQRVAIAGIAAGITVSAVGCTPDTLSKLGVGDTAGKEEIAGDIMLATSEVSQNNCSKPEGSKVSEIIDGEMVEVVGEMPDYSDGETMGEPSEYIEVTETEGLLEPEPPEITNPYEDVMGEVAEFSYDIKEVAKMESEVAFELFKHWSREYIDYDWREYIVGRELGYTKFSVYDGEDTSDIWFYFDADGNVTDVHIYRAEEELMGDIVVP